MSQKNQDTPNIIDITDEQNNPRKTEVKVKLEANAQEQVKKEFEAMEDSDANVKSNIMEELEAKVKASVMERLVPVVQAFNREGLDVKAKAKIMEKLGSLVQAQVKEKLEVILQAQSKEEAPGNQVQTNVDEVHHIPETGEIAKGKKNDSAVIDNKKSADHDIANVEIDGEKDGYEQMEYESDDYKENDYKQNNDYGYLKDVVFGSHYLSTPPNRIDAKAIAIIISWSTLTCNTTADILEHILPEAPTVSFTDDANWALLSNEVVNASVITLTFDHLVHLLSNTRVFYPSLRFLVLDEAVTMTHPNSLKE
uniref:Helicase ATP-binding domain-containing protein n=1 Tax=Strongyloides papillosus TaxID=174720 RepID=A0A0N5CBK7_STREA